MRFSRNIRNIRTFPLVFVTIGETGCLHNLIFCLSHAARPSLAVRSTLHGSFIALNTDPAASLWPAGKRVQEALKSSAGIEAEILGGANADAVVTITLGGGVGHAQGYRLSVKAEGITIAGDDAAGAYYGAQTLAQLLQTYGKSLPLLVIEDYPDFPARGVMLDISRDKVPSMETLYGLIDWLATLKINQFQLYTEHTFAYRNHPTVWANASPITAEQILATGRLLPRPLHRTRSQPEQLRAYVALA